MPAWIRQLPAWLAGLLAGLLRGVTRCLFPLGIFGAWLGVLGCDQARDVLRRAVESAALDRSFGDLVALAISSLLLALSVWYAMRCLLKVHLASLPLIGPATSAAKIWWPRAIGALVLVWPAYLIHAVLPSTVLVPAELGPAAAEKRLQDANLINATGSGAILAFLALTLGLVVFLAKREQIFGLTKLQYLPPNALPAPIWRTVFWSLAVMALCGVLVILFPQSLTRFVGSGALLALALACINVFGSFVLTFWPLRSRLPLLAPWVLAGALALSPFTDNHAPSESGGLDDPVDVSKRPDVATAFDKWLKTRGANSTAPVYVVATEGGGLRAAYWTASVLERLARTDGTPGRSIADDIFAISSVSGGSVGASFWVASQQPRICARQAGATLDDPRWPQPDFATRTLADDHLSPSLGLLLFPDLMQRFWPIPYASANRSRGLEERWQRIFESTAGNAMSHGIDHLYQCDALPQLLLNSTVAGSGQRAVLTHLRTDAFDNVLAFKQDSDPSTDHQSLAGLVHHSARFPVISPAGSVVDERKPPVDAGDPHPLLARLVDGGYFDNSGLVTALETIRIMQTKMPNLQIVLIMITDDSYPECVRSKGEPVYCDKPTSTAKMPCPSGGTAWLNELLPIASALFEVRDAHVHDALDGAMREVQVALFDRSPQADEVQAPLGWALSRSVTNLMKSQIEPPAHAMSARPPAWMSSAAASTPDACLVPHAAAAVASAASVASKGLQP